MLTEPVLSALALCRTRLGMAEHRLQAGSVGDVEALAALADAERAMSALGATIGFERRAIALRTRAAAASTTRNP